MMTRRGGARIKYARSLIRHPIRWLRWLTGAGRRRAANRSRWSKLANFDPAWDERTRLIADRLKGVGSVLEFGSGRGALRVFLDEDVEYLGSDIVARDEKTLVWDLNAGAPTLERRYDAAVFSGVLEYVADLRQVLNGLRPQVSRVVTSYASIDDVPDRLTRLENGWVNHLTGKQFVEVVEDCGFELASDEPWLDSRIYDFRLR